MQLLKNKYKLIWVLGIILIAGFLSIGIAAYIVSRDAIRAGIVQQALPLTADNIYSEIQKDLLRPVFISSMMAQDTFVREWMIGGERDTKRIERYLKEIKTKYGANTAFLVSENSRKYYFEGGVLKIVSKRDTRDKWYFRVREMRAQFESNVDLDQANRDQRTVFVNYRVHDYRGNYIGATGVGLTLDKIGSHIDRYQSTFNRRIFFVDRNGQIVLTGQSMKNVQGSIRDLPGIDTVAEQILKGGDTPKQLEYHRGQSLVMVNSRYIPELGSYLLVEQDEGEDIKDVWRVLLINLGIGSILGLLALAVMRRVVDRYQQRLESMTREVLSHAARETEMAREQQEFVAMVSHEFRTPIAIIDSSLQGLKRHEHGMPDEVSARYGRIRRATLRLQELIGNFLAGDRLKQARFLPGSEHIDLFQLVARAAERVEFQNMIFRADELGAVVAGDTELLRVVFFNILNNAIKYSPPNGAIHVDGLVKEGFAEVRIRDSGTGIAPADLMHIFEKHYRAVSNKAAGSGLGLYIVRRIVELHGGTVSVDSVPDQGTTICVRLPVADHPS